MKIEERLRRSILRSEKAYELYLADKRYYQALRIFKANEIVYNFLKEFVYECEEVDLDQVFMYIFHLEDWFESFNFLERTNPSLDELFIFERLNSSPVFPVNFIKNVLSK